MHALEWWCVVGEWGWERKGEGGIEVGEVGKVSLVEYGSVVVGCYEWEDMGEEELALLVLALEVCLGCYVVG